MQASAMSQGNGMAYSFGPPPPQVNQPPQIFGNYNADGSPIPPNLTAPLFSDDDLLLDARDDDNPGDAKRRRIARVFRAVPPLNFAQLY